MRKLQNDELNRLTAEEFLRHKKNPVILVLDNVRSHLNVGSIFRTADAFLIEAIYLCGITGVPPHRDIHKTALGATETVAWKYFPSALLAIHELKKENYKVIVVEQVENSIFLNDFQPDSPEKYAIIFGNEVEGVQQEVVSESDIVLEIPQWGMKHSLNVSVSVGVVLWDLLSKKI